MPWLGRAFAFVDDAVRAPGLGILWLECLSCSHFLRSLLNYFLHRLLPSREAWASLPLSLLPAGHVLSPTALLAAQAQSTKGTAARAIEVAVAAKGFLLLEGAARLRPSPSPGLFPGHLILASCDTASGPAAAGARRESRWPGHPSVAVWTQSPGRGPGLAVQALAVWAALWALRGAESRGLPTAALASGHQTGAALPSAAQKELLRKPPLSLDH